MDYSQIDKAPEEKARGITISTAVRVVLSLLTTLTHPSTSSTRLATATMPTSTVPVTPITSRT